MEYEIVATLGPGSDSEAVWTAMLAAGATGFRLNTSHLTLDDLAGWLTRLSAFLPRRDHPSPSLVLDLQGSKWRLGRFPTAELVVGHPVELTLAEAADRPGLLPVPHGDFFRAAAISGAELLLNDAKIRLAVESLRGGSLSARVLQGGPISSGKGITYRSSRYRSESLSDKDREIVARTRRLPFVRYALSYVKDAAEMARYRALIGPAPPLIAKLERQPALDDAEQIAGLAEALWLCRGDLGAELDFRAMAEAVHRFSGRAAALPVPVLLAGQVLEH
ncbi:MAG: pyruvate kinase, partial [Candidatus Methylomirabilota bacterium]